MKNLKKVIALVAVFAMMVSTVAFAATFSDVPETSNYYEAIETLNKLGIITGDPADENGVAAFRPEDTITRAEVAAIVCRMQGANNLSEQATVFEDVPATHWASGYVASAQGMGIINGYGDGNFGPEDPVLYEQAVKMMMETLGYKPFADENGGYPTGYLTAAQRYDVLEGVVGASVGVAAPRGVVAQLAYNAIDTPLMDRYQYGDEASYIIYDGTSNNYKRQTLLSRDLKISKLRGQVIANTITDLRDGAVDIDTEADSKITLYITDNYDNDCNGKYEIYDVEEFYTAGLDVDKFLGYTVNVYVKEADGNDDASLVSITEATGKNKTVEFNISDYDELDGSNIKYKKNASDRTSTKISVEPGAIIVYNGVTYAGAFGDMFGGLIEKNSAYSGKVVALDANETTGYEIFFVEIAATGVVDEVNTRGVLTFKNEVGQRTYGNVVDKIDFETDDTDSIITITKDGEPFDYTELKEWDVVTIIYNDAQEGVYDIRVLGDSAITGKIESVGSSDTSATGSEYTIGGEDYDAAVGYYSNASLKAGAAGTFYIDEFGKLVAYDKNKTAEGQSSSSDKYAYILAGTTEAGTWDDVEATIQFLDKDGNVYQTHFASTLTIENAWYSGALRALYPELTEEDCDLKFKIADDDDSANVDAVVDALVGQLVTYSLSSSNEFKTITLPVPEAADNSESTLSYNGTGVQSDVYDEEDMDLGSLTLTEDTKVFFINGEVGTTITIGEEADEEESVVGAISDLGGERYTYVAYDVDDDDVPAALVIFNETVGTPSSSGIAYVISVGKANVDDESVYSVKYYQGGEIKQAYTDDDDFNDFDENVVPGSIFKFGLQNGKISTIKPYLTFDGTVRNKIKYSTGEDGEPNVDGFFAPSSSKEKTYFGAVVDKSGSKVTVLTDDGEKKFNLGKGAIQYYAYDPAMSKNNKLALGSSGDIVRPDEDLVNPGSIVYDGSKASASILAVTPAYGMLDYVFIREYDGDVVEVVVYLAYEYKGYDVREILE